MVLFMQIFFPQHFFVPNPLEGGGAIYSNGFFSDNFAILADRYNNRRELRVVSLESPPSVKIGIKNIFTIFDFYREFLRFKILRILDVTQLFIFTVLTKFLSILTKLSTILVNNVKMVNCSVIDFVFKDRGGLLKFFV